MTKNVRVRFAPSPTGPLHIGGVRTALFNYLFAKKHNGTFILRIEDTDQNRYVEGAEQYIIDALNWCGLEFDEGPQIPAAEGMKKESYRQSERKHLYKQYADKLIASGNAYFAFDTAETLDFHRKDHEAKGKTFIYNWRNRLKLSNSLSLSAEEVKAKLKAGDDYVIRFKSPQDETLHLKDIIRGDIKIDTNILDDKVLFKSDGMPTYHLANIVDDHLMEISHVIRGEEWLPSLALHYQLYKAFGWETPEFAHLPLILKPTGKGKLSKRDGDKLGFPVFPLQWTDPKTGDVSRGYKEDGYFPEAMVNFLAFLGWNPGTEQEIFSLNELIEAFDLKKVNKAGARFDPDKTKWFNHHYMQEQDNNVLAELFIKQTSKIEDNKDGTLSILILNEPYKKHYESFSKDYVIKIINLVKERAIFVSDLWDLTHYFFTSPKKYDEKSVKKAIKPNTEIILSELIKVLKPIKKWKSFAIAKDLESNILIKKIIKTKIEEWINSNEEINFGKVMMPLRLALVGALQGPDVFDIMYMIGKNETVKRIENVISEL